MKLIRDVLQLRERRKDVIHLCLSVSPPPFFPSLSMCEGEIPCVLSHSFSSSVWLISVNIDFHTHSEKTPTSPRLLCPDWPAHSGQELLTIYGGKHKKNTLMHV